MSVVIIGGGITGLAIGCMLQEEGIACTIIERADEVGGLARSYKWSGISFDLGPHFIFPHSHPEAMDYIKEVLENKYYVLDYKIGIHFSGRYHSWPPKILKMITSFPPGVALHHIFRPFLPGKFIDESFQSCITVKHGNYLYENFFSPYIEKKTGLPGKGVHIDWWLRPFRVFRQGNCDFDDPALKLKVGRFAEIKMLLFKIVTPGAKVLYPYGGMGTFPDLLSRRFTEAGGTIKTGVKDFSLVAVNGRITEVLMANEKLKTSELVWTAPIDILAKALKLKEPELIYLPVMLSFVRLKRNAENGKYLYVYYGDRDVIFNRAYFPSNIHDSFVPKGKGAVCVEITPREDEVFKDKSLLREMVARDLEKVGICSADSVEDMEILTIEKAYPLYTVSYKKELSGFMANVEAFKNVWIAGRAGGFYNVLTDGAVKSALDVVKGLREVLGKKDV